MNVLTKELQTAVLQAEQDNRSKEKAPFRMKYHLMPPTGWLNDPNGLCFHEGVYHVFFQYSPLNVRGGMKVWGHYTSRDLVLFQYEGAALFPDQPFDCHGVYSGSALSMKDGIHLFYTGNIKYDGNYDYITQGREANVIHAISRDGRIYDNKQLVLTNADYPAECTAHVRDPKVWQREDGTYGMVLGARLRNDQGAILIYHASDLNQWKFEKMLTTEQPFGYMWECPDFFTLQDAGVLAFSPQGIKREKTRFQNIYQAGYVLNEQWDEFTEWDMGFDFYAAQTFVDAQGRRILIGWAGLPDVDAEYTNPTIGEGWQHCLTLPRELTMSQGKILQYPVAQLDQLHGEQIQAVPGEEGEKRYCFTTRTCDLKLKGIQSDYGSIILADGLELSWNGGQLKLEFSNPQLGAGRTCRYAQVDVVEEIRLLADVSIVEIYVNRGEVVFTSRFYECREELKCSLRFVAEQVEAYEMEKGSGIDV